VNPTFPSFSPLYSDDPPALPVTGTGPPLDRQAYEESRVDLRALIHEIQTLCHSDVPRLEFYQGLLSRLIAALAAHGGAIWLVNAQSQVELECQTKLRETGLTDTDEQRDAHLQLLRRVIESGQPFTLEPRTSHEQIAGLNNPSEYMLLLCPLKSDQETIGVVAILQRPGGRPTVIRGWERFLGNMCALAGNFIKTHRLREYSAKQDLWTKLEQFARNVHRGLHPDDVAATIANEGRRLIECDRVTVALAHGTKAKIAAISGQDSFDKRANAIRLLTNLCAAVMRSGEPLWYFGDTHDLAPQVEQAIQDYVDEAHGKVVAVLPVRQPTPPDQIAGEVLGAVVIEQFEEAGNGDWLRERAGVVSAHAATALANALEHHSLFLLPVWKSIGKASWLVKARTLPKTVLVAGALVAAILALCIIPADFDIEAKGTLEPIVRRDVFAPWDGVVQQVAVDHGQNVAEGDTLLELKNTDLSVALTDLHGRLQATRNQIAAADQARSDSKLTDEQRKQLAGQVAQLTAVRRSLEQQLELLKEKAAQLHVASPIKGQVVTWQAQERLILRPVQRGQVLLTVANPDGPWNLELHVPEDKMGYVAQAARDAKQPLKVNYILATNPGAQRQGTVAEIHTTAELRGDEGNTVLVKSNLTKDGQELSQAERRPGASVTAKINCGRRSLGYVWFHDVWNFVQSKVLFRL